jgi:transposase
MPRYKYFDYKQTVMLPLSLENQLLPGTFEFALQYLIESRVDLSKFEAKLKNDDTGSPAYHPRILLKIILYGYSQGIVSSRKLEKACKEHVIFMALSCLAMPDHSTIAEFVSSMKEEIEPLFVNILLVCEEMDLLGHTEFALDGLKLPSNASKEYSGTHWDLGKKREKLRAKIAHLLGEQIQTDKADSKSETIGNKTMCDKTEETIKRLRAKAEKIEKFLAEHEPRIGKSGKEIQSNITDNESAKMKTSHGVIQGYNGQALVDEKHQVIVYAEVSSSGQDYNQLSSVIDGAKENVGALGFSEDYFENTIISMDSNYHSKENLEKAEEGGIDAYIPDVKFRQRDPRFQTANRHKPEREEKYKVEDFRYDEERDCYICPSGKELRRYARVHKIGNIIFRRYGADEKDCANCFLREKCLRTPGAKSRHLAIAVGKYEPSLSGKMIKKIDTPEGRKIYSRRMKIVEPVFANIRTHKRLDRFTLRGRIEVNIQWLLYCIVHNIGKIAVFGTV